MDAILWALGIALSLSMGFNVWIAQTLVQMRADMAKLSEQMQNRTEVLSIVQHQIDSVAKEITTIKIEMARYGITTRTHES
jgi:3-dehydroquinate dehydratase